CSRDNYFYFDYW
nr:immunoglobulin heavy chain junction region [Mus musculus]